MTADRGWKVYLLECADQTLYCGVSRDVSGRVEKHNAGKGAKYTRTRRPVSLVAESVWMSKSEAFRLEYRIKQQPAAAKIKMLLNGCRANDVHKEL